LRYGLVCLAVFVWGAIIYRVVAGMSGPESQVIPVKKQTAAPPARVSDNFVLNADYPDPFIPEADTLSAIETKKTVAGPVTPVTAPPVVSAPPEPAVSSFLQYIGMIGNPGKKRRIAILSLHGKEILVKENEKKDGVLVKKIDGDRIRIVYKGKVYIIEKNS